VAVGDVLVLREDAGRFILEKSSEKIDLAGIAGSMPWLETLSPEERAFDERELPWDQIDSRSGG
jgi:antitoxin VapB